MHSPYKLVLILAFATLPACDVHDDDHGALNPAQASESGSAATQQRINATTPEMLSRSYQAILGSMSVDQREEFLKALVAIMKAGGHGNSDADAAFRTKINGKTASAIIAEARATSGD